MMICVPSVAGAGNAAAVAATIFAQHGAAVSATSGAWATGGLASRPGAAGWTSAPAAKNTAAGATTPARRTAGLLRSLANSCRPTHSTLGGNRGKCHEVVTKG